jgi:segregation and condensation protein B
MELSTIIPHIEALIFASDKPLTSLDIVELINNSFGFMENRITLDQVESAVEGIREKYNAEFYPFEVRESGGGWQFLTKKDFHKTVGQLNGDKFLKRLSNAALETLAIIAYKQPITKGEIEAIRGVNSDYSVQKLLEKELIIIAGRSEDLPGKPLVYTTSKNFMDYFGLNSVDDLPKIKEVLAEQQVEATLITDAIKRNEASETEEGELSLSVTGSGELVPYQLGGKPATHLDEEGDENDSDNQPVIEAANDEPTADNETKLHEADNVLDEEDTEDEASAVEPTMNIDLQDFSDIDEEADEDDVTEEENDTDEDATQEIDLLNSPVADVDEPTTTNAGQDANDEDASNDEADPKRKREGEAGPSEDSSLND